MDYTHIFFDLDGTLVDSAPGIRHSVRYAMEKMGVPVDPDDDLSRYIGPPLVPAFMEFAHMSCENAKKTLDFYRECYRAGAMYECRVYDGIPALLGALRGAGYVLSLATCKPLVFAKDILCHLSLDGYFRFFSGSELNESRNEKSEVIDYAAQNLGVTDKKKILLVGDRDNDVKGANAAGTDCAGALWGGYAEPGELDGATFCVRTPEELRDRLIPRRKTEI